MKIENIFNPDLAIKNLEVVLMLCNRVFRKFLKVNQEVNRKNYSKHYAVNDWC